jgi:hypothetical protein
MNIIEDNLIKLNKFKVNLPSPSYIAGLIDGDGAIFIRKIKGGYQSGISLTQSRTNILQIIQYHYGGIIIPPTEILTNNILNEDRFYDKNNKRNSYNLIIRSNEYNFILNDIYNYIILKKSQINALMEFSKIANKSNMLEEKEELYKICKEQNFTKEKEDYDFTKLNIDYIKGLFEAEGHIFVSYKKINNEIRFTKGVYIKITQKSHPQIIKAIHNFLNFGKINDYIYYVDTFEDCLKLIELIKDNLIIKENQINAFEEYLKTRLNKNEKYAEEIHIKRLDLYKIINMEKHQIEIYNEIIPNKEGYEEKLKILNQEIANEKELKRQEFYLAKSESMKGENHYFYGQKLSEEHSLNISIATTNAKRANNPNLTNEKIREIYELKDKSSQISISKKYEMHREIIRRIWNRELLPTDDPDFINKKQELIQNKSNNSINSNITSEQKTSIGKRSLNIDEYIEILQWKIKKNNGEKLNDKIISSTKLSEYLSNLWKKKVSNDIIKNTWNGRTKLFDFEFIDKSISYDTYLELIEV